MQVLTDNDPGSALLTWEGDPAGLTPFLEQFADAVFLKVAKQFYATAAGTIKGLFEKEDVTFLIDSSSELNLITCHIWEQANISINEDASRWSLHGINGCPVPLLSCACDAPVQIQGKNFNHHFFVSTHEHGQYDGILSQPWLHWYSANINYNRNNSTYLQAFTSGNKTGGFISIPIALIEDPHNTDHLLLTSEASTTPSSDF